MTDPTMTNPSTLELAVRAVEVLFFAYISMEFVRYRMGWGRYKR